MQRLWTRGAIYLVLTAFAAYFFMPFYVMLITGLKPFVGISTRHLLWGIY
jgi:ABC-type glycerol-3-phosphate transport system permease component